MCIYSYLFCLYWCKDYCHRVTTQLQLGIIIIIIIIIMFLHSRCATIAESFCEHKQCLRIHPLCMAQDHIRVSEGNACVFNMWTAWWFESGSADLCSTANCLCDVFIFQYMKSCWDRKKKSSNILHTKHIVPRCRSPHPAYHNTRTLYHMM